MAVDFSKYEHLVTKFNSDYGVNFSYREFETSIRRLRYLSENFVGQRSPRGMETRKYVGDFEKIYKQALVNLADRRCAFKTEDMVNDFRAMMDGYRSAMNESGQEVEEWAPKSELVGIANNLAQSLPDRQVTFAQDRYLQGKLPIREMRAHANHLLNIGERSTEAVSAIINYANALKNVNGSRSFWWRVFHPFRNNAEQREAESFINIAKELLGKDQNGVESAKYVEAVGHASSNLLVDLKADVRRLSNTLTDEIAEPTEEVHVEEDKLIENKEIQNAVAKTETVALNENVPAPNEEKKEIKEKLDVKADLEKPSVTAPEKKDVRGKKCTECAKEITESEAEMEKLKDELWGVIEENNVPDSVEREDVIDELTSSMVKLAQDFNEAYDEHEERNASLDELHEKTHDDMAQMYSLAYNQLKGCRLQLNDRIVAAQKLANIVVNKVSPVAFRKEQLEKFSTNYALKENKDIVDECILQDYGRMSAKMRETMITRSLETVEKETKQQLSIGELSETGRKSEISERQRERQEKSLNIAAI